LLHDHNCRRSMNNSNIITGSNDTFLLSFLRPATISVVRRNRSNRKFSASCQNAPYRAARIEPTDQTIGSGIRDLPVRPGSSSPAPYDRRPDPSLLRERTESCSLRLSQPNLKLSSIFFQSNLPTQSLRSYTVALRSLIR
jgi:hypothetical protein